jgi:PHD/YefM family antitoxin component YafN of YafNO toxin-antitoxin module
MSMTIVPDGMTETVRSGKHEAEWITISVDEYESMRRTIEVLSDRNLMEQIREAKKGHAKTRDFGEVARELGI